jgi:VWFA-related protein
MRVLVAMGIWLLVLTTSSSAWAQTANQVGSSNQAPFSLQVNSQVVLTDVTVTDHQGNPVAGLTQNDFQLLDNGKPQKLASFDEHRQRTSHLIETSASAGRFSNEYLQHPPAQINVLLFDTTTIGIVDQMYLFEQMKQLVNNLPSGEPVAVFTRAGPATVELASFTDDHALLLAAIRKAIPRLQQPGSWMASDLDTLLQIAAYMENLPGRKNLLWFTSGSNMFLGPNAMAVPMDPAARRAVYDLLESERIAIYPIDARGLTVVFGRQALAMAAQQMQMRQDAAATGGTAFVNTNGLALAAQRILARDGDFYTLSYTPNNLKNNNKWHRVEVKLVNAQYELSYRHGYFDDGANKPQLAKETKIRTALRAGGNKIEVPDDRGQPIIFTARVVPAPPAAPPLPGASPPKKGQTRYIVEYSLPVKDVYAANPQGNVGTSDLGTAVFVYNQNGELLSRSALKFSLVIDEQKARSEPNAPVNISHPVNLPRGSSYLYLGLWDMSTGRMGTVNAAVDVQKPTG